MEELCKLVSAVKEDKEKFILILEKFKPLICKYANCLYMDEKEDMEAELTIALWEAVIKIEFCCNDGQVTNYLVTSIKNRYFELYRASKKLHDNTTYADEYELDKITANGSLEQDLLVHNDMIRFESGLTGKKKQIFEAVFISNMTDIEVAHKLDISRQYVHRIRMKLCNEIKNYYF